MGTSKPAKSIRREQKLLYVITVKVPPGGQIIEGTTHWYGFNLIKKGKVDAVMGDQLVHCNQGDLIVVYPEMNRKGCNVYECPMQGISLGVKIRSNDDLFGQRDRGYFILNLESKTRLKAQELFDNIYYETAREPLDYRLMVNSYLTNLLTLVRREVTSPETVANKLKEEQPRRNPIVEEAKKYIQENYKKHLSLGILSGNLYVSASHLRYLFRNETGTSVIRYIIKIKLGLVKDLLKNTEMTVAEIAYEAGFENLNYFYRLFKRVEGLTPLQYRKFYK